MKRRIGLIACAVVVLLAGCSSAGSSGEPAETIELGASNMAYSTGELILEKGRAYRLVLANRDSVEHDVSVTRIPVETHEEGHAADHGAGHGAGGSGPDLHVHADAGNTEAVEFTPTEAGTYEFYCTVVGHKEAGMVGKLIVQ